MKLRPVLLTLCFLLFSLSFLFSSCEAHYVLPQKIDGGDTGGTLDALGQNAFTILGESSQSSGSFGSKIVTSENFTVLVKTSPLSFPDHANDNISRSYDRFFEAEAQTLLEGRTSEP